MTNHKDALIKKLEALDSIHGCIRRNEVINIINQHFDAVPDEAISEIPYNEVTICWVFNGQIVNRPTDADLYAELEVRGAKKPVSLEVCARAALVEALQLIQFASHGCPTVVDGEPVPDKYQAIIRDVTKRIGDIATEALKQLEKSL